MTETNTLINWPARLKIGARSKKGNSSSSSFYWVRLKDIKKKLFITVSFNENDSSKSLFPVFTGFGGKNIGWRQDVWGNGAGLARFMNFCINWEARPLRYGHKNRSYIFLKCFQ